MKVITDAKYYDEIARTIELYGDKKTGEKFSPSVMAQEVSNSCIHQYDLGIDDGQIIGRKAQYDEFWDALQNNGGRTNYTRMFSNALWTDALFKPKYDFDASTMYQCFWDNSSLTSIKFKSDGTPLIIDGSNISTSTGFQRAFYSMSNLVSIGTIISRKEAPWTDAFKDDVKLQEVRFGGIIGKDIDFSSCSVLSDESVTSIKEHLFDFPNSENESERDETRSIKFHSKIKTKLGTSGIAEFTAKGWSVA